MVLRNMLIVCRSQEGDREQREVGTTQVGGGEDTGVAREVP